MVTINLDTWDKAASSERDWLPCPEQSELWQEYDIRPGIRLLVQNLPSPPLPHRFDFEVSEAPVEFLYCLSGRTEIFFADHAGMRHEIETRPGCCTLSYFPAAKGTCVTQTGTPLLAVGLQIAPGTLRALAPQTDGDHLHATLHRILHGNLRRNNTDRSCYFCEVPLPLPLRVTVKQILESTLQGELHRLFLEYKAMELFFTQLSMLDPCAMQSKRIDDSERRAAQAAHAQLMQDISSPPSLQELARNVGLTHTRLNKLFRKMFGNTVFGLLRIQRLECARRMLEDGRRSIAEVAYECGFSNPSHFSRTFSEYYGVQPKRYQEANLQHAAGRFTMSVQTLRPAGRTAE